MSQQLPQQAIYKAVSLSDLIDAHPDVNDVIRHMDIYKWIDVRTLVPASQLYDALEQFAISAAEDDPELSEKIYSFLDHGLLKLLPIKDLHIDLDS